MRALRLRAIGDGDLRAVAALNDREVPRVGPLGVAGLRAHLPRCDLALAAVDERDALAGFVLALAPGVDYPSENYRWFEARGDAHLYIDRVVVGRDHRRLGCAGLLYDAVASRAREVGLPQLTCEVNVRPSNPASTAFHERRGFVEVGRQDTTAGTLTVALMALALG